MTEQDAYRVLGVQEGADKAEITRKYEVLLKRNKIARTEGTVGQQTVNVKELDRAYKLLMGYTTVEAEEMETREREVMSSSGLNSKKLANYFHYYKFHILIGLLVILFLGTTIRSFILKPEPDFNLVFAGNLFYGDSDKIKVKITSSIPSIKHPVIDSALSGDNAAKLPEYNAPMKLTALLAAGDIDVFILDREIYERLGSQGALLKLDSWIAEYGLNMDTNADNLISAKEEKDKHLYGIDVTSSSFFKDPVILGKEKIVAISIGVDHKENAEKFVQLLLGNK